MFITYRFVNSHWCKKFHTNIYNISRMFSEVSSLLLLCPQALPTNPKALLRATPENRERERVRNSWRNGQRWTTTHPQHVTKPPGFFLTKKHSTCKYVQVQVLQLVFFRFKNILQSCEKTSAHCSFCGNEQCPASFTTFVAFRLSSYYLILLILEWLLVDVAK